MSTFLQFPHPNSLIKSLHLQPTMKILTGVKLCSRFLVYYCNKMIEYMQSQRIPVSTQLLNNTTFFREQSSLLHFDLSFPQSSHLSLVSPSLLQRTICAKRCIFHSKVSSLDKNDFQIIQDSIGTSWFMFLLTRIGKMIAMYKCYYQIHQYNKFIQLQHCAIQ